MGLALEAFKNCVEGFACGATHGRVENFEDRKEQNRHFALAVAYFLLFLVVFVLILFFGKFLWNNFAAKYITILKPIPGVLELLAIMVLSGMLFPSCC